MKIISVNVGMPRLVEYLGEPVATGIYKSPVEGKVAVNPLNLAGDAQADLRVHGGVSKSVYAYPSEHYAFWQAEYPDKDLPIAIFGENLTTRGIVETEICAGDRIRIGTAEFVVTEPRFPCYKLGIRFGEKDILRRFQKSRRSGFYLSVAKTGELAAGDKIEFLSRDPHRVTIEELVRLIDEKHNPEIKEIARRAANVGALDEGWKQEINKMLA
jgi:MOSC domain-containing protein YiiM